MRSFRIVPLVLSAGAVQESVTDSVGDGFDLLVVDVLVVGVVVVDLLVVGVVVVDLLVVGAVVVDVLVVGAVLVVDAVVLGAPAVDMDAILFVLVAGVEPLLGQPARRTQVVAIAAIAARRCWLKVVIGDSVRFPSGAVEDSMEQVNRLGQAPTTCR
ncbi:MAG TPA: hypothetical protein VMU86_07335 [Steroidobacteraceae bacterium]|nr:hypothetical protein [Steroidobacteraceae bacterium]